ncbi:MAG: NAD(P)-binding domain-containing protein [Anaerolineae bacterium]
MSQQVETVIVGGGQAGLATSYCLKQQGLEHIVLERSAAPTNAWRERWDSFTLVTPNWMLKMPGAEYADDNPNGFLTKDEIIRYFESYVSRFALPVHYNVLVNSIEPHSGGYRVTAAEAVYEARHVIVATGLFQTPKVPAFATAIPSSVLQLHSGQYRNPNSLPPGGVLVVGTGQSGCQIAEELYQSGRKVFVSVGSTGRAPRRYRGKDCFEWLELIHFLDRTPDKLPSPAARFAGNPHTSGRDGGHNLNLHQFARDGVALIGHVQGVEDGKMRVAGNLKENLAKSDGFEGRLVGMIDAAVEQNHLDVPEEKLVILRDGYDVPIMDTLNLKSEGIGTIIWAMGYDFSFDVVKLPIFDSFGYPLQQRGITDYPGLYFMGLPWLHTQKSGLIAGLAVMRPISRQI